MLDDPPRSSVATPACGQCGAPVAPADVTCPACGVLLAAYQVPAGAGAGWMPMPAVDVPTVPAAPPTPSSALSTGALPPSPPPPVATVSPPVEHRPRSLSPIGDALRRSREDDSVGSALEQSASAAGTLAEMAASDSDLARDVEAELADAKVTFNAGTPVIETASAPDLALPPAQAALPMPVPAPSRRTDRPVRPGPDRAAPAPARPVTPAPREATASRNQSGKSNWGPILVMVVLFLAVSRGLSSVGAFMGLVVMVVVVVALVRLAGLASRKTTTMPWDDAWNSRRRK